MLKLISERAAWNPVSPERGISMAIYVCPICDKKMMSKHFCTNCRSYIKEPFVREMTYYLNERHPEHEADCTYHQSDEMRGYQTSSGAHQAAVPNQSSLSSRAALNEERSHSQPVPNQPTDYNRAGVSMPRQEATPNRPRVNNPMQSVNAENMEQYMKAMKDIGRTGLHGLAEALKDYNEAAGQNGSTSARQVDATSRPSATGAGTGQGESGREKKTISPIAMIVFFIIFVNIFSEVIVPFLRYLMTSIF